MLVKKARLRKINSHVWTPKTVEVTNLCPLNPLFHSPETFCSISISSNQSILMIQRDKWNVTQHDGLLNGPELPTADETDSVSTKHRVDSFGSNMCTWTFQSPGAWLQPTECLLFPLNLCPLNMETNCLTQSPRPSSVFRWQRIKSPNNRHWKEKAVSFAQQSKRWTHIRNNQDVCLLLFFALESRIRTFHVCRTQKYR